MSILQQDGKWLDLTSRMSIYGINVDSLQKQISGAQVKQLPDSLYRNAKVSEGKGIYTIKATANKNESMKILKDGMGIYTIKATANKNESMKILKDGMGILGQSNTNLPKNLKVSEIVYTIKIDAKTKLPTQTNMNIVLELGNEKFNEKVTSTYTKWGKVKVSKPIPAKLAHKFCTQTG